MTLYITGDVHGDAFDLLARAEAVGAGRGDEVLVLGDVGLMCGADPDGLPHVTAFMAQLMRHAPWRLVVMRGNHDVRYERDLLLRGCADRVGFGGAYRVSWRGGDAFVCDAFPNVVFLPDAGGLYDIGGSRTLVVPGAYSADKGLRLGRGLPWEPAEQLDASEMGWLLDLAHGNPVRCVLSHTCPKSWQMWMGDLLGAKADADDTMERWMDGLLEAVRPSLRRWAFGHCHGDRPVGFGLGRLMYRDIAEFGSVVDGDVRGTARPDLSYRTSAAGRSWMLHRVLGGAPESPLGYTTGELSALTGCPEEEVERIMYVQSRAVDPDTGELLTMEGDVPQIVYAAWRRGRR